MRNIPALGKRPSKHQNQARPRSFPALALLSGLPLLSCEQSAWPLRDPGRFHRIVTRVPGRRRHQQGYTCESDRKMSQSTKIITTYDCCINSISIPLRNQTLVPVPFLPSSCQRPNYKSFSDQTGSSQYNPSLIYNCVVVYDFDSSAVSQTNQDS
jgi:hypothetical protein